MDATETAGQQSEVAGQQPEPVQQQTDVAEQQAEAAAAASAVARVRHVETIVDQWVTDHIHNSPASRDTRGFNHLHTTALPELKRRLLKGLAS